MAQAVRKLFERVISNRTAVVDARSELATLPLARRPSLFVVIIGGSLTRILVEQARGGLAAPSRD